MSESRLPKGKMYISELFKVLGSVKSKGERIEMFHEYIEKGKDHALVMQNILECLFPVPHKRQVTFDLPGGPLSEEVYKPIKYDSVDLARTDLFKECTKLARYCVDSKTRIPNAGKREKCFIQLLEALHEDEAAILLMAKDKNYTRTHIDGKKFRGLTQGLAHEAFPNWVAEPIEN